nr:Acetyltransferase (GNAT) domain protein [uncultured bacterium]
MDQIQEDLPSVEEYCHLRKLCGMAPRTAEAARIGLPRSLYSVTVRQNGKLIGMGRVIGDLGCHVQITDIAVHPDYQRQGISHQIMKKIMFFIEREVPSCAFVNLFADVHFLYQKYGFMEGTVTKGMYLKRNQTVARESSDELFSFRLGDS